MVGLQWECEMWKSFFHSEVGWSHVKRNLPCQDFCFASSTPFPYLIVCDGAGSAPLSHFGSKAIVESLSSLISVLQEPIQEFLDEDLSEDLEKKKILQFKKIFINASLKELEKLESQYKVPKSYFRSTLILFLLGKKRSFWLKLGDGAILIQNEKGELELIGPIQKGEYANETVFLSENMKEEDIACDVIKKEIQAVIAFTDGAGEKLISHDGKQFAPLISKWFKRVRKKTFTKEELVNFLSAEEVWSKTTGDDKSIAMLVLEPKEEKLIESKTLLSENLEKQENEKQSLKQDKVSELESNKQETSKQNPIEIDITV